MHSMMHHYTSHAMHHGVVTHMLLQLAAARSVLHWYPLVCSPMNSTIGVAQANYMYHPRCSIQQATGSVLRGDDSLYGCLLGSSVSGITSLVYSSGDTLVSFTGYTLTSCYAGWWYSLQMIAAISIGYIMTRPLLSLPIHTVLMPNCVLSSTTLHTTTHCYTLHRRSVS